ncbi:NUDIX family hydrolase [Enterococcus sp. 10A9_DIV0425]|uniref:NUDIX family hydrolase n=1 Tax=Candidatus Enterococcus wittei TaxID=1987383 RepID=A0A242JXF8_9ENTE|nr:NUDIX domain-containing protein [Enterococcus sp. 10A9_DIV0425]OTP09998.1 NUDIX family hydrolase [Enterococcus sp. 10A9_DIV0425]THE06648.1 NUDIX domain-containing protein [Enterococcus hirae]
MNKPIFGEKNQTADYQDRYAAYIIVPKNEHLAVIEAPNGAFFLPGGEIEGEETKEEAIRRELMEEMGIAAEIDEYLGEAVEYFYSNHRQTYYHNPGYFYVAKTWYQIGQPTEKTNRIWWVTSEEALAKLKRGSHRWAVEKWLATKE